MEYKERAYQWADGIIDDLLVFPEIELDIKNNCVAYQDIVDKIVEYPEILERCENLPLSKDPVLVYEAILRNPKVKEVSKLYQNNPFMQFYVTCSERGIERLGSTIISSYVAIYLAENFDRLDLTYDKMLKKQKEESQKLIKIWEASFREDRPPYGYYPTAGGGYKTEKIKEPDRVFGEKSMDEFYAYVDKKGIDVSEWSVKITENMVEAFKVISLDNEREIFYEKLPPIMEERFNTPFTKQKIDHLLDGSEQDFIEDVEHDRI